MWGNGRYCCNEGLQKLVAQIVVSSLIVIGSDIRIRSLFGIFGVYELEYFVSVIFSIVTFIILINAFQPD